MVSVLCHLLYAGTIKIISALQRSTHERSFEVFYISVGERVVTGGGIRGLGSRGCGNWLDIHWYWVGYSLAIRVVEVLVDYYLEDQHILCFEYLNCVLILDTNLLLSTTYIQLFFLFIGIDINSIIFHFWCSWC
jgi:hypothetical protein